MQADHGIIKPQHAGGVGRNRKLRAGFNFIEQTITFTQWMKNYNK